MVVGGHYLLSAKCFIIITIIKLNLFIFGHIGSSLLLKGFL